jgi:hypothetical protein
VQEGARFSGTTGYQDGYQIGRRLDCH